MPRGPGGAENSDYLSSEFSDGYTGFAKGYYMVVAALAARSWPTSPAATNAHGGLRSGRGAAGFWLAQGFPLLKSRLLAQRP